MRPQFGATRHLASVFCTLILGTALMFTASSCEDQAIGRTCKTLAPASDTQGVFNDQALECPSRLCIKPSYDSGKAQTDTAPFCTAGCGSNSDCDEAEKRDMSNPADKRCTKGFVCAVPFVLKPLSCKKLCVCEDFVALDAKGKAMVPSSCVAPSGS